MSKTELLNEIDKLPAAEREELWEAMWELEEKKLSSPTVEEKALLDEALDELQQTGDPGSPWAEAEARLRSKS